MLLENYPQLPVAGMMDVLRDAEYVLDRKHFDWFTVSAGNPSVTAMNGTRAIADFTIDNMPGCDTLVVCGGFGGHAISDPAILQFLRRQAVQGVSLVAIATGTWLLAKAGLIGERRVTLHWEDIPAFEEQYPLARVRRSLFVQDGKLMTCAGGTSSIDMFLHFISHDLGPEVAAEVARQIMHHVVRQGSEGLPIKENPFRGLSNEIVRSAVRLMHNNMENPIPIAEIAKRCNASQKRLERLFHAHLQTTPQLHYRAIRLDQARALMRLTTKDVWEVAIIVGFSSPQYLSRCYKDRFGITPTQDRAESSKFDQSNRNSRSAVITGDAPHAVQ